MRQESPSRAPANNGMHTVRRNPNSGLAPEVEESLSSAFEAAKSDPEALQWVRNHKELWVRGKVRRGRRQ